MESILYTIIRPIIKLFCNIVYHRLSSNVYRIRKYP